MKSTLSIKMTLFIIGFMVVLDQVSKYIIKNNLDLYKPKQIFGSFFRLTYIENEGAAFGVQLGSPKLFLVLSIIAAILVFYYLFRMRDKNWLLQLAMSFIAAGAIGNLSDRILHGKVVDFFDIEFFDISIPSFNLFGWTLSGYSMTRWPIFNVADIAITCGMIIILSYLIFIGDPLISFQKQTASLSNESNGNI